MYIFVFNWTPALSSNSSAPPPFGLIFAAFMIACMGGSSLFGILAGGNMPSHRILIHVFLAAALALAIPIFASSNLMTLVSFMLFEACVGMYWPAIGGVKSQVVPEESRATIYNIYRVPLNGIVLGVLLNHISTTTALSCCSAMLLVAFGLQRTLSTRMATRAGAGAPGGSERGGWGSISSSDEEGGDSNTGLLRGD
jgi:MFS family permease